MVKTMLLQINVMFMCGSKFSSTMVTSKSLRIWKRPLQVDSIIAFGNFVLSLLTTTRNLSIVKVREKQKSTFNTSKQKLVKNKMQGSKTRARMVT